MMDAYAAPVAAPTTPGPAQRKMMLIETLISTAINALAPAAIIWALALKPPPTLEGQAVMLGRATILATFLMSLIVTALVRGRLAKGAPPLARGPGWGWIPRLLPLRALFWTVCGLLTVLPIGVALGQMMGLAGMSRTGFFFFNVLFGAILGVGLTPFVVWLGLTDTPRASTDAC